MELNQSTQKDNVDNKNSSQITNKDCKIEHFDQNSDKSHGDFKVELRKSSQSRNIDSKINDYDEDCKENSSVQNEKAKKSSKKLKEKDIHEEIDQNQGMDCQICAYSYDKIQKVPRILQCGHTFCQDCLGELRRQRGPDMMCIQCPNCRNLTHVVSISSLPENEYIFQREPQIFSMNIFSPYEAAKRLGVESKSLIKTGIRYHQFLNRLQDLDYEYEKDIVRNYEEEYTKVDSFKEIMIKIITDYTDQTKDQLLSHMNNQRKTISEHIKEIGQKIKEIECIIAGVNVVEQKIQKIQANEEAYMHKQMQQFYNQVDIEESIGIRPRPNPFSGNDDSCSQNSGSDKNSNGVEQSLKKPKQGTIAKCQNSPNSDKYVKTKPTLDEAAQLAANQASPSETRRMGDSNHISAIQRQDIQSIVSQIELSEEQNSQLADPDAASTGEYISLEHLDKLILQNIRTDFYKFNTQFEQILKFKAIRRIQLSSIDINIEKSYQSLQSLRIDDRIHSYEDKIRNLELELDLKDYYDIKRPTVVFFGNPTQSSQQLNVTRYDILSDTYLSSDIKMNSLGRFNPLKWNNGIGWTALSHPSNNSIFLINGPEVFLFDNQNELMLLKQSYPPNEQISKQAICYNEGFIYMLGGYCAKQKKQQRSCTRYNIVTEKWQQISPMIFEKEEAAACAINEFQIIVAGGRTSDGNLTDIVEMYDLRENTWKVFSVGISNPRCLMAIVSAQKDRAIIIGGQSQDGEELNIVEEIDFLKVRNSVVTLNKMKSPRARLNAFIVNDSIYVMSATNSKKSQLSGEKYILKENKWKDFEAKNVPLLGHGSKMNDVMINNGPAALLYE